MHLDLGKNVLVYFHNFSSTFLPPSSDSRYDNLLLSPTYFKISTTFTGTQNSGLLRKCMEIIGLNQFTFQFFYSASTQLMNINFVCVYV